MNAKPEKNGSLSRKHSMQDMSILQAENVVTDTAEIYLSTAVF